MIQRKYTESRSGQSFGRSEGLAVASLDMFLGGLFSLDPATSPLRVDAEALQRLTVAHLRAGLQVDDKLNPLVKYH